MAEDHRSADEAPRVPWYNDPIWRGYVFQGLTLIVVAGIAWTIVHNTAVNLEKRHIAQGFGFLSTTAGFDLAQESISFPKDASYGRALLVGLVNTVIVAVAGIVFATIVGFLVGVGRLSHNFVISRLCTGYVELLRNIPLLLQIFFWYFAVLGVLPSPRDSIQPVPGWVFLNNRGLYLPEFRFGGFAGDGIFYGLIFGLVVSWFVRRWASKRQMETGQPFPAGWTSVALIVGLPLVLFAASGFDLTLVAPKKSVFNLSGGIQIIPELMALVLAISLYTASFIAEVVRAGILAVSHGQTEAARSLGLSHGQTLRLVVIPQAMRVIIPPLTNQYLNLTKNSSLAVAIAYPDLVSVGGIVLNQSGQAIEVIAIWMAIYLGTSVATAMIMNAYNRRMAIVER
ncbi:amino acid ABC transporter permease [Pinisolibacter aquiterrae]|uniref:amino acid ABC transporter permease n=1 Tax=Pinisolibacter aquiterrae TaxID=2815579 RepID=UPI001C3C3C87|nr:amino acid ABC transporter permease [Pinisolibacter aquiterrae]MBV5264505.1 amino acid ABC transporter permease [Pinisolibacter aquiterrae]MCC8235719.1 amino acid ABC transporter permease [Pinisolibacter aquiterrae]